MKIQVKWKKLHPKAISPSYAKSGDAAMDLTSVSFDRQIHYIEYGTGLSVAVPEGFVGLLFPRSSCTNKGLILGNSVGVIDSGYRGEIKFRFYKNEEFSEEYMVGDRIGQLMIMPYPETILQEVTDLDSTDRDTGGFGSTNNKS